MTSSVIGSMKKKPPGFWLYRNEAFHLLLYRLSRHSYLEVIIWLISIWMDGDEVRDERDHDGDDSVETGHMYSY